MSLDFVALDFETANSSRASACSIGLVKVQFGQIVAKKSILFKPPVGFDEFNGWNIAIHGITPAMVADRPRFEAVWPEISSFIGDQIVVAHNASFDISVLRASLTAVMKSWRWPPLTMPRPQLPISSSTVMVIPTRRGR